MRLVSLHWQSVIARRVPEDAPGVRETQGMNSATPTCHCDSSWHRTPNTVTIWHDNRADPHARGGQAAAVPRHLVIAPTNCMQNTIYIATSEPNSGKTMVALGVMEMLSHQVGRVAYFRPVVRSTPANDPSILLMRSRYRLQADPEAMYGANRETTRALLAADRTSDLIKQILEKVKSLQEEADLVVCEGTSFAGLAPAYEFDLNAEIASNLNAAVLHVATARDKTDSDVRDAVGIAIDQLTEHRCEALAAIVNHVPPERLSTLQAQLQSDGLPCPVFTLPNEPSLDKPTLNEIASAIGATGISGEEAGLATDVQSFVVAAMQLPNFLEHLRPGSLVITPGDRADILVGGLASLASRTLPNIAGFILTGGLSPSAQVMKLVKGLPAVPILGIESDTFETATKVATVPAVLRPENERKITSALGLFETHIDLQQLEARVAAPRQAKTTPLMFEYELLQRARLQKKRIVLPEGSEPRILRAVDVLLRRRVVDVILLGIEAEIRQTAASLGITLNHVEIVDPNASPLLPQFAETYFEMRKHKGITEDAALDRMRDVSYFGTMMVYLGIADGMVSGSIHTTAHTIRPAFEFIKTKPGVGIVSSVFFMCLPDRVLVYGDCAINPDPTAAELAEIALSSADTAAAFGIEPRVAMLSYSTGESGTGVDVDKVREATALARRLRPAIRIEGPIQYDAAVDPDVAKTKLASSEVAGRATVLVFPDLNAGNNAYKAVQRSSGAIAIGPVLQGLRKPVNDLSRGCTVTDIVNTVAITAIQAQTIVNEG